MSEFNDLELNKDISSMDEEEAKKTLSEFMESHKTNRTAYDELQSELDDVETEYKEKLDEKEDVIQEFREQRAEEASEYVNMPAELIASRFEYSEIEQIIEEAEEFSESEEEEESEEDVDSLTTFSEKPEKGRRESNESHGDRERAKQKLGRFGFPTGE